MAAKKSIFQFGDLFGYESPFERDWVTEMREEREERERKREEREEMRSKSIQDNEKGIFISNLASKAQAEAFKQQLLNLAGVQTKNIRYSDNDTSCLISLEKTSNCILAILSVKKI